MLGASCWQDSTKGERLSGIEATNCEHVFSGVVTQADSDELTQEMLAAMMREADTSNPTPKSPGATLLDTPEEDLLSLKDRVRLAMYSKLEDGSLEQAVQVAADAGGAQHFSDVPPPPPPEDLCEEDQELKEPEVEPVPAEETRRPTPQDLAALRRRTAELLAQAADSGGLGEILAEVKREMFLEVRQRVAGLLTEAADNGDLEKILEDVKGPPLPQEFAEKETSLRQKAARLLTEAADTGLLERVLQKGLEGHIQAEADRFELERREDRQVCHEAPDQDLAEVRAAAKAALLEAAETGALERAVADLKVKKPLEKSKEDTKSKAAALLCEAAESGRLQQALSEVRQTFTVSQKEALLAVRQRAAGLLSEAAVDGKLERILTEIGKEEIQTSRRVEVDVRSKVRTQLQEAALDGRLEAALANASEDRALDSLRPQEPQEPQEAAPHAAPAEAARQRIRARLLEGLEDGRLEQAVAKEAKHASAAKVTSAVTKVTMEEFSAKMFLEAFAEKGQRLQSLLRSIAEAEVQIRLREQRCQQLQARVSENKLELAHLDLDSEWCAKLLESAEERRKALQQSQRRLLGTLHGKMHELASAS
ncbi:KIF13B [Symbiodinium pilosum]|uniref:KIF13B protein n=1 Tax=Symbiodinium pilosum TaxID=2952 RepID=A0A812WSL4_SYMPI|nr:KIF13B [Symbiodinium pilosum]